MRGLGDSSGFTMQFQNRSGMSRAEFVEAREKLLAANANPRLTSVRLSDLPDVATLKIDVVVQILFHFKVSIIYIFLINGGILMILYSYN